MPRSRRLTPVFLLFLLVGAWPPALHAANPPPAERSAGPGARERDRGGPGGGSPSGVPSPTRLVERFDRNGNHRLEADERQAARKFLAEEQAAGRGPRRPGPPGGGGGRRGGPGAATEPTPTSPGRPLTPKDITRHSEAPLFDESIVRTLFLEFENGAWEEELAAFYHTDVEVPAKLTVDGRALSDVGVHFRGASSFFTIGPGQKRSINLTIDHAHPDQRLYGVRTLNLLNAHTDPTFLRSMLYYHVAREFLPAPRANLVRVVINGESWGIYVAAEQVNVDFLRDRYQTTKGHRWKVPGSPRGRGSLAYLGEDPASYERIYDLKSKADPQAWKDLIRLCRVLDQTPPEQLEAALRPILDVDGALRFLALENVFINNDGYWIRNSDYHLYEHPDGRFRLLPHDANETFRAVEGFGFGAGPRAQGVELPPLTGADDPGKPLLSKLLAVPSLRRQYLGHVRAMSDRWLDWSRLEPLVTRWHALIDADVKGDVHRLYSYEAFRNGLAKDTEEQGFRGPQRSLSLKGFAEQRRAYLAGQLGAAEAGR